MNHKINSVLCSCLLCVAFGGDNAVAAELTPQVAVNHVRRAFDNGEHNAFTDLIRWNGKFWLTFRSCAEGHPVNSNGAVIVLSSPDAKQWTVACRLRMPESDTRGPHFFTLDDKLFVVFAAIYPNQGTEFTHPTMNPNNFGCTAYTSDGEVWSKPLPMKGTNGYFLWGASSTNNKAYVSGRRTRRIASTKEAQEPEFIGETVLFESNDGFQWKIVSRYYPDSADETSFLFESNGDLLGVTRRGGPDPTRVLRSKPPYQEWTQERIPFFIGGPLIKKWGDRYIVGGRRNSKDGKKTGLWWLVGDQMKTIGVLPSGGDNSYPGFAAVDDTHGVVSWYSSHEKDEAGNVITAIYVADLQIVSPPPAANTDDQ
tara:strand:- start:151142 stop:152248 length:1107 start_codon:yes stop_codon:yes gene_type:complete